MDHELKLSPMEEIKRKLAIISTVIPPGSNVVYVDYPVYENIGDLLIMKGTEAFFRDYGIKVRRRYCYVNYRRTMKFPKDWIIVCQGGGNFGDLYPQHHRAREQVIQANPQNRIVILPQTIHFHDPAEEKRSLSAMRIHPDLHLFVRDEASYRIAKRMLDHVYLAPDMAHQLYPLPSEPPMNRLKLALLRTDGEKGAQEAAIACDKETDWPRLFKLRDRLLIKLIVRCYSLDRVLGNPFPLQRIWYSLADRYIFRAMRLFGEYDQIVTTRLHGHILSCLMDKPNLLLDNSYGKNSSYYRLWTYRLEEQFNVSGTGNDTGDLYTQSS